MNRQNIIRRLLYLRNWEFANIFILPIAMYAILKSLNINNWWAYIFTISIVCFILAQGVFYWHLKLQSIYKNQLALPAYFNSTFTTFKWINIILLFLYFLGVIFTQRFQDSLGSNLIFIFAIAEHINYYHYQLSHDNLNDIRYLLRHKKIRRSPLFIDLQKTNI